jgi:hypothetical protein
VLEGTFNGTMFGTPLGNSEWHGLQFINTNATKTASRALNHGSAAVIIYDCIFGGSGSSQGFWRAIEGGAAIPDTTMIWMNEIRFSADAGIVVNGALEVVMYNYVHDNANGIRVGFFLSQEGPLLYRNLIVNNTGKGVDFSGAGNIGHPNLIENTIDGNGSHGVDCGQWCAYITMINNQITNNGGFGVTCTSGSVGCNTTREDQSVVKWNNFFNNASGARNNFLAGENETAVDPLYINRAGKNWCIPDNPNNRGGPPGPPPAVYRGTQTQSLILKGACQPVGGAGANVGI